MKYSVDTNYMLDVMRELIETPSPVGYYVKIYKQYRKTRSDWIKIFVKLLEKSKYSTEEAVEIVSNCLEKRYWISEQFYIKPSSLVQRINELGLDNLEML